MKKFMLNSIAGLISRRINKLIAGIFTLLMLLISSVAHAIPVWTITPLTSTTIAIPFDDSANIRYLVTNNSRRFHILAMLQIPGISQDTSPENCPNPFF